jgi:hypothetical protein
VVRPTLTPVPTSRRSGHRRGKSPSRGHGVTVSPEIAVHSRSGSTSAMVLLAHLCLVSPRNSNASASSTRAARWPSEEQRLSLMHPNESKGRCSNHRILPWYLTDSACVHTCSAMKPSRTVNGVSELVAVVPGIDIRHRRPSSSAWRIARSLLLHLVTPLHPPTVFMETGCKVLSVASSIISLRLHRLAPTASSSFSRSSTVQPDPRYALNALWRLSLWPASLRPSTCAQSTY